MGSNADAITIDQTKPDSLSLALGTDSGSGASDGITNVATVTIRGIETGATWQYSTDGGTTWNTGTGTSFNLPAGSYSADQVQVRQTDVAGNTSLVLASSKAGAITIDTTAPRTPTVSLDIDSGSNTADGLSNAATVNVSGLDTDTRWQYSLDNGQTWNDGTDSSFDLERSVQGSQTVQVRQTDLAGNTSTSANTQFTLDTSAPTLKNTTPVAPDLASPSGNLVMQFGETVSKGTGSIFIVDDTNSTSIEIDVSSSEVVVDGDTVTINPAADLQMAHSYHITVQEGALVDAAGNHFAGISDTGTWRFSVPDPAVSLDTIATDGRVNAAEKAASTLTLSGALSSTAGASVLGLFTQADFAVTLTPAQGSAVTATVTSYNSSTGAWSATVNTQDLSDQSYSVSVAAAHGALSTSTSGKFLVDTTVAAPEITLGKDSGSSSSDAVSSTGSINVSGLEAGATWEYSTDGGAHWTTGTGSSFAVTTDGAYSVQVRQSDTAGNTSEAATLALTLDTQAPSLAISSDTSALKAGETATITFTFSEDPGSSFAWDGTVGDIVVTGGSLSAISGSGLTRTATFTPTPNLASGSASITVASGAYSDAAGNTGGAGTTPGISIDTLAPTVTIESDVATLQADEQATIYFTLSETSTDFDATSITVTGGTLDELIEVDDGVYGAFFTPDADSTTTATITVASGAFTDQAGNANTDGSDDDNTVSITLDTVRPAVQSVTVNQDGQLVLTFDSDLDTPSPSNITTFASRFDVRIDGVVKTIQSAQVSGHTLTLSFSTALGAGDMSFTYTDPDSTTNNQNVIQSVAGNDITGFTLGVVADGYVSGAQIYIDTNANGLADSNELQAGVVTSAKGAFLLPRTAPAGVIIAVGGTNIDTGLPQTTPLKAPAGSRTINPLTTLVQSVIDEAAAVQQTLTPAQASDLVTAALGLSLPTGKTLTSYDPLAATDGSALAAQKAASQLGTLAALMALDQSGTDDDVAASERTFNQLAQNILRPTSSAPLDLSNTSQWSNLNLQPQTLAKIEAFNSEIASATTQAQITQTQGRLGDSTAPTITIASNKTALGVGETATITFTLSEASTDFAAGDITYSGGTLSGFTGSGTSYSATFTPTANSTTAASISVASSTFSDAALNKNADGSDTNNAVSMAVNTVASTTDTTPPTVAISSNKTALGVGETATITVT